MSAPVTTGRAGDRTPRAAAGPAVRLRPVLLGAVLLAVAAFASLFVGVADVTPADLLRGDTATLEVFFVSRVPRLIAILLAGAALSVSGLIMQHLTRNRFVAPDTAGTVEWALLGILVATLFLGGQSVLGKMLVAVAFSLVGTFLFLRLLRRVRFTDMIVVPLVGSCSAASSWPSPRSSPTGSN